MLVDIGVGGCLCRACVWGIIAEMKRGCMCSVCGSVGIGLLVFDFMY